MTKLATRTQPSQTTVLAVRLGEILFAIPIEAIEEVLPALPVEAVAGCPSFVRGVVFVRGHLIPVLSAAERLGMVGYQRPDEPHIVCLRQDERLIGVEFDEALDLMEIGNTQGLAADELGVERGFLRGLVERDGRVIRLLDPTRLIASDEALALQPLPKTRSRTPAAEPPSGSQV